LEVWVLHNKRCATHCKEPTDKYDNSDKHATSKAAAFPCTANHPKEGAESCCGYKSNDGTARKRTDQDDRFKHCKRKERISQPLLILTVRLYCLPNRNAKGK